MTGSRPSLHLTLKNNREKNLESMRVCNAQTHDLLQLISRMTSGLNHLFPQTESSWRKEHLVRRYQSDWRMLDSCKWMAQTTHNCFLPITSIIAQQYKHRKCVCSSRHLPWHHILNSSMPQNPAYSDQMFLSPMNVWFARPTQPIQQRPITDIVKTLIEEPVLLEMRANGKSGIGTDNGNKERPIRCPIQPSALWSY